MTTAEETAPYSGRTAWARNLQTPLREFVETEIGGAAVLLVAAAAALLWINIDAHSYDSFWSTTLSIDVGDHGIALDLRQWVNSGLMTFFFFVVGLEARREFDLGELRERRRFVLPLLAALGGIAVPIAIYLSFNAGQSTAHGWGVAMSTDTAFALGLLALVGPRFPARLRAFMLTIAVVDDIVALVVIAVFYSDDIEPSALLVGLAIFSALLVARAAGVRNGILCLRRSAPPCGSLSSSRASIRSWSASSSGSSRSPTPRRGRSSSAPPSASAPSASSRRRSWRGSRSRGSAPPSPRTSACSRSSIRGRAI